MSRHTRFLQVTASLAGLRLVLVTLALAAAACSRRAPAPAPLSSAAARPAVPSLRDAFGSAFMIGAALNDSQFFERDTRGAALVKKHFNTITPENVLKWIIVHPRPGVYDFTASDRFVEFGRANGMVVIGHTLVWHNQTPRWVFEDAGRPASRDTLIARMRDHIHTVVGRYKGRIRGWDVVNEALNEDGTMRRSPWHDVIGDGYLAMAFEFAREADPEAELYYNDYSVENAPKRDGAVALIRRLQARGIRVAGMGLQGHNNLDWPTAAQQDSTISAFAALGVKVMITELDVDVLPRGRQAPTAEVSLGAEARSGRNPYTAGLPDSVQERLARKYAELFAVYLRHRDSIDRVTFWGVADGDSWLNNWPLRGRTSYPLLFDRAGNPKPAFDAIMNLVRQRVVSEDRGPSPGDR